MAVKDHLFFCADSPVPMNSIARILHSDNVDFTIHHDKTNLNLKFAKIFPDTMEI